MPALPAEFFNRQMWRGARASVSIADFARVGFGVGDHFFQGFVRRIGGGWLSQKCSPSDRQYG